MQRWKARPRLLRTLVPLLAVTVVLVAGVGCQTPRRGDAMLAKRIALMQLSQRHWASQAGCLRDLWQAESGWNVFAMNRSSGAYGIPQALPGKRMAAAGRDWVHNPSTQIRWGLSYIAQRYGGPCNAWRHWRQVHWYSQAAPGGPGAAPVTATPPPAPAPAQPAAQRGTGPTKRQVNG